MSIDLSNYTTVNERTLDFYKQYPAGVITTQPAKIVEVGGNLFISVIARVYLDRHMEDAPVTEAEAWEPYPGTTPFTRNSEMMNCATSAIGRALGQLGIGIEKGMASNDEVKVAQQRTPDPNRAIRDGGNGKPATPAQIGGVKKKMKAAGLMDDHLALDALSAFLQRDLDQWEQLRHADITPIFDAPLDVFKNARHIDGMTIITRQAPAVEDDPWAGEVLA